MTPQLGESIHFEDNKLAVLPTVDELLSSEITKVPQRFLHDTFGDLSKEQEEKILLYIRRDLDDQDFRKIFDYNSLPASILEEKRSSYEKDISDVHRKVYEAFKDLSFTQQDIDYFYPQIITIYKQLFENSLSDIEAQVNMQITTIANNIMLRRATRITRIGEDSETKAMTAHIIGKQS